MFQRAGIKYFCAVTKRSARVFRQRFDFCNTQFDCDYVCLVCVKRAFGLTDSYVFAGRYLFFLPWPVVYDARQTRAAYVYRLHERNTV